MLVESISDLMVFTRAVKGGSLSAAGRELGISLAVASKRLQRLEEQLGVRLLNRSTRQLSLTDEGAEYYHYCVRILAELEEGEEQVTRGSKEPKGNLKVTVPAAFGRLHVAPLVPEFLKRYPAIRLTLHLTDSLVDIIDQGYDLAVRIGELKDSSLVAKSIGRDRRVVVATPSYLARYGAPRSPLELSTHNALLFAGTDHWSFTAPNGEDVSVKVSGNLDTNNCDALREAIYADLGLALRPMWDVWQDLRNGRLVRLLPDYAPPAYPINAVYPSRRLMPKKTRIFIDHLLQRFGPIPYWDDLADQATLLRMSKKGADNPIPSPTGR
ncbi:MAG: LysR family transcriptional regulator [Gammaproteobacteria bacterium]|nr:LysR family transcriptional regulator [Gammaproteobacteria bacterium]